MDSAFPPFKVEHRYKGVYERAGFDVNLGGPRPKHYGSDGRSIISKSSSRFQGNGYNGSMPNSPKLHSNMSLNQKENPYETQRKVSPITSSSPLISSSVVSPHNNNVFNNQYKGSSPATSQHPLAKSLQRKQPESLHSQDVSQSNQESQTHSDSPYDNSSPPGSATIVTPPYPIVHNDSSVSFSDSSQSNTNRSTELYNHTNNTRDTSPPSSPDSPGLYKQQLSQSSAIPTDDKIQFSPTTSSNANKNYKNLQLNLGYNSNKFNDDSISEEEQEQDDDFDDDTKDTTISSFNKHTRADSKTSILTNEILPQQSQKPTLPSIQTSNFDENKNIHSDNNVKEILSPNTLEKQRLSSLLQDFKKDIEDHKNYIPKQATESPKQPIGTLKLPDSSPSQLGLSKFEPPENSIIYSPNPQHDFQKFQTQKASEDGNLNNDYQNFLNSTNSKIDDKRTSQLSTVSSIISKDSVYDDEEDEIERELSKQLENLKTNGSSKEKLLADKSPPVPKYNHQAERDIWSHNYSNQSLIIEISPEVPTFNIEDADTSKPIQIEEDSDFDDLSSHASFESVKPLSVRHSRIVLLNEEQLGNLQTVANNQQQEEAEEKPRPRNTVMFDDNVTKYSPENYHDNDDDLQSMSPESNVQSPIEPITPIESEFNNVPLQDQSIKRDEGYDFQQNYGAIHQISPKSNQALMGNDELSPKVNKEYTQDISSPNVVQPSYSPTTINQPTSPIIVEKPLSPKTHYIEEELKNINFKVSPTSSNSPNSPYSPNSPNSPHSLYSMESEIKPLQPKSIDSILGASIPSRPSPEFEPFPKSITSSPIIQTNLPGEGPCRHCHNEVKPNAKGLEKSIFSKTGELSGQWHRSCFSCFHTKCDIKFNKHVQCYAFKDQAYCHQHYHELNDTICFECKSGIEGECIENELGQKWHLNCLKCEKCCQNINKDYFVINNLIYCDKDANNIFNGQESFNDLNGNVKMGGLSTSDKIEKRRTRVLFVE